MRPPVSLAEILGGRPSPVAVRPLGFDGWSIAPTQLGYSLIGPGGAGAGEITVHERHPLVAIGALAGGEPTVLVTVEGEYAALADKDGGSIGIVVGDDWCMVIDGAGGTVRDAVRTLAVSARLGLGDRRRRWYLYQPPPGYAGACRAQMTEWRRPGVRIT